MTSQNPVPELERFAHSLVRASKLQNPKLKSSLYLEGPPGVGKTESVYKLGKLLDVAVFKVNLAEFQNIAQLKGIACEFAEDSRCGPGFIANQLLNYPHKIVIFLFDEADQVLNRVSEGESHELVSFMLDLLEGKTHSLYNPYFGFDMDIRYFGIILAGNRPLHLKALRSRLNQVLFGNYTKEYRIQAGRKRFVPEILDFYQDVLTLQNLNETDWKAIDQIAIQEHQKLEESGEDPGFREQIRELERFFHQKVTNSPSAISSAI